MLEIPGSDEPQKHRDLLEVKRIRLSGRRLVRIWLSWIRLGRMRYKLCFMSSLFVVE